MAAWPDSELPAPQWDSLQIEVQDAVLRSQMDSGPGKTRRRFTTVSTYIQATWVLTRAQFVRFVTFYESETFLGSIGFDWVHPVTNATVQARFRKPPNMKPMGSPMIRPIISSGVTNAEGVLPRPSEAPGASILQLESYWQVTAEIEVLPI
jgi:hypothetical protein